MKLDENAFLTFRSCLLQCQKTNLKLLKTQTREKFSLYRNSISEIQNKFGCKTSCDASVYYIEINVFATHFRYGGPLVFVGAVNRVVDRSRRWLQSL